MGVQEEKFSQNGNERIFPTRIEWGGVKHSKENLGQRLTTNINPSIRDLRIYPVRDRNQVIFVIDIPQSENPPHMASDRRHYFRNNFTTSVMEHYQVADLFGRRHPALELKCEFKFAGSYPGEDKRIDLTTELMNVGRIAAKNWLVMIEISGVKAEGKDFLPKWEFVESALLIIGENRLELVANFGSSRLIEELQQEAQVCASVLSVITKAKS